MSEWFEGILSFSLSLDTPSEINQLLLLQLLWIINYKFLVNLMVVAWLVGWFVVVVGFIF